MNKIIWNSSSEDKKSFQTAEIAFLWFKDQIYGPLTIVDY